MGKLSYSTGEVQNRLDMVGDLQQMISSPYNFKGAVATLSDLPSTGNTINDTYYVEDVMYRVTWTGSAWVQSSMDETDYTDELNGLKADVEYDMIAENYVEYNSLTDFSFASSSTRPAFFRRGNRFSFNGSFGSSAYYYVKLSKAGTQNITSSANTAKGWPKEVPIKSGHTYKATLTNISGTYSGGEGSYVRVGIFFSDDSRINVDTEQVFTATDNLTASVIFVTTAGETFANAVFQFVIKDITEPMAQLSECLVADYSLAESIPSYADLNDFTADGNYKIAGTSEAETIDNLPPGVNGIGRLFVMHPYNSQRLIQIFFDMSAGLIFTRRYTTSWGEWGYLLNGKTDVVESGNNLPVTSKGVYNALAAHTTLSTGLAYSWWVNNRVVDSYGTLYFGYISEGAMCGVGCRYADGTVKRVDLFESEDCDDHNAPSVIILTIDGKEYVCVIGSTGHNTDSKINCYVATEPNSITCDFDDRTYTIASPSGYKFECSYSQAYFDTSNSSIYNFFRIKQTDLGAGTFVMVWMCGISEDYGDTWSIYRVFATGVESELFYMWSADTRNNTWLKRVVLQTNTTNTTVRPIRAGYINPQTLNILDASADSIGKPMTLLGEGELAYGPGITIANYDDFTSIIPVDGYRRYRILDVSDGPLSFLYAKSVENVSDYHDITDWVLYRYSGGTVVEIAHLGLPFFVGSAYVTGACYIGDEDTIVYSKNDSATQDGKHTLHKAVISNNAVLSDEVIKTSSMTMARPARYDMGSLMILIGKYREGSGTRYLTWHFGVQFFDVL